ncbi:hypothetical protein JTE90_005100 [Oedothorax gibbosus]|uniref:Uncharacterized protein n=1 Tax=Oedothorax gibbosus TaxID=931172 RepID=A0AAV6VC42_9ARAC|nr:hypothetical protein JTE90_005100 [Oedothorax gibbosus]
MFDEFIQDHADMDLLRQKEAEVAFGLFVLPYVFKENLDSIIKVVPDGGDTPDIEFFAEPCPQIHLSGNVTSGCYTIFCEGRELCTCQDFINALCRLMSYYYTLNVEFPKKAPNTMTFVKCALLKIVDGRIPPKVKSLMAKANTFA